MTYPVYTIRFGAFANSAGAAQTIATVPVGYVWIIRCMDFVSYNSAGTAAILVGIPGFTFYSATFPSQYSHQQWTGSQAMKAGEALSQTVTSGAVAGVITGYQFVAQ